MKIITTMLKVIVASSTAAFTTTIGLMVASIIADWISVY